MVHGWSFVVVVIV